MCIIILKTNPFYYEKLIKKNCYVNQNDGIFHDFSFKITETFAYKSDFTGEYYVAFNENVYLNS